MVEYRRLLSWLLCCVEPRKQIGSFSERWVKKEEGTLYWELILDVRIYCGLKSLNIIKYERNPSITTTRNVAFCEVSGGIRALKEPTFSGGLWYVWVHTD